MSSHAQPTAESRAWGPEVVHFDATERRRAKMRSQAAHEPAAAPVPTAPVPAPVSRLPRQAASAAPPATTTTPAAPPSRLPPTATAPTPPAEEPAAAKTPVAPEEGTKAKLHLTAPELERFLVQFVVEQTGYPPEIVELDADLEADLGIDSIKKAQLFGELREYFDVTPTEGLSLDDFPTLRHVVNYLQGSQPATPSAPPPRTVSEPAAKPAPAQTEAAAPAAASPAPAGSAPAAKPGTPAAAELESFLINFVVEQTGYPPEIVELDADLEADLGIDSIKKAQLFGELREYFDVTPTEGLSLDDFPTLRHVVRFLRGEGSGGGQALPAARTETAAPAPASPVAASPVAASPVAASAAPAAKPGAPAAEELESFLVNFVVEQTGYPPEIVELDADLEADLGIDSIKKAQLFGELREYFDVTPTEGLSLDDFPTLRHVVRFLRGETPAKLEAAPAEAPTPPAAGPAPALPAAPGAAVSGVAAAVANGHAHGETANGAAAVPDLEAFLVNFVVEQTGYPPEIVELDADLEADLGIDSIKKAQLFGELREYFDVTPTENLTLDDFPTLRHVVDYLRANAAPRAAGSMQA